MAALFHVFVDGVADGSVAGLDRLADEMATKYGLARNDLQTRLQRGRLRVKANVDRSSAETLASELRSMGARCVIEDATGRPTTPPPVRAESQPAQQYQSGLSAAFSGELPKASLGALETADLGAISLSSVDGADAPAARRGGTFTPPASGADVALSASIGPPVESAKPAAKKAGGGAKAGAAAKPARPKDEPVDLFAPPDAGDAALSVDLAPEEIERAARKRASTPPVSVPVVEEPSSASGSMGRAQSQPSSTSGSMRRASSQPIAVATTPLPQTAPRSKLGPFADERVRFAVGVVLAIGIGFVPATVVASIREKSAFAQIDDDVATRHAAADSLDEWQQLDAFRTRALERKHEQRRSIALVSMAIWALVGGGFAYLYFRRIPWDRLSS
jgi:hypothetical protein